MTPPVISVVIPVYNCADCVRALHERLTSLLPTLVDRYEIVFVDDRSPDGAWAVLTELAREDPSVRAVRLSRNFGQHIAITAGIAKAEGAWIVLMDCDLQDSPEDIPLLWEQALEGHDVVFTRRVERRQSRFRRLAGRAYFRLRDFLLKTEIPTEMGSLMLFSRKVADAFLRVGDKDRQHGILLTWLGFDAVSVPVAHAKRHAGRSSYTFGKLVATALDGLFFQTTVLLRWIVYLGLGLAFLGLALAVTLVAIYFLGQPPPGWTSLAVLLLLIGGFVIIALGVTALYIGKIFEQVKDRPLYIVDEDVVGGLEPVEDPVAAESHRAEW